MLIGVMEETIIVFVGEEISENIPDAPIMHAEIIIVNINVSFICFFTFSFFLLFFFLANFILL